ncbi:MAG: UDP binding domain-containing protein [Paracoccaceae bacterium]
MKVAMSGTGYVGLVSGVCFSDYGPDVICMDKSADKIAQLQAGIVMMDEQGLDVLRQRNVDAGRLTFTTVLEQAVAGADAVFIAADTPARRGDGHADLTCVMAATEEISRALTGYADVVTKSTVPVGTNRQVAVLGVTSRPHTDDMRGRSEGEHGLPGVHWHTDACSAAEGADLILNLTEWNEFRTLDPERLVRGMKTAPMADLRNLHERRSVVDAGFVAYDAVGR